MKIGPATQPTTGISGSNPETIVIRGHDLVRDLIGRISFTDHVWLLVCGTLPNDAQRRILDATLVAIAEHGLVPSVQAARMTLAAAPEALQGAVAAGLLGCGSVILGASQDAGRMFSEVVGLHEKAGGTLDDAASEIVGRYRSEKRAIPGYGHPLHKGSDPRAVRLIELARELGVFGRHSQAALRGRTRAAVGDRQAAGDEHLKRHSLCAAGCRISAARTQGRTDPGAHSGPDRPSARGADPPHRLCDVACGGVRHQL